MSEAIHLYALRPIDWAGELLGERRFREFAQKSRSYYLKNVPLNDFTAANSLSHFYAYVQEALVELGWRISPREECPRWRAFSRRAARCRRIAT